jgi:hypothetical protein
MEGVQNMTTRLDMTIGDIVTADHRAAAVFDRYGLDSAAMAAGRSTRVVAIPASTPRPCSMSSPP